jgi:transcriptional regulator with XRE-family HTH domain
MSGDQINYIGKRIKEIRLSKGLKLTDVAITASISKGLLSRIENIRTIPSLPVLFNIIASLKESPAAFFENIDYVTNQPFYLLLKKENYQAIEKEDSVGYHYFNIISQSFKEFTFNAVFLTLDPNAKRDLVTTDGMEFIYLIDGEISYRLNDVVISMEKGDSLFFDGRVPHLKLNKTAYVANILVIYLLFN